MLYFNKKIIATVRADMNAGSLRLTMREEAKRKLPKEYFEIFNNEYGIKNVGCLVFGQPNTWKGVLAVLGEEEGVYDIVLDTFRTDLSYPSDEVVKFIENILNELEKNNIIKRIEE